MYKKLHKVKDVAVMLPVPISNQKLYSYLKKLNIVSENREPNRKYVQLGYLVEVYGSKCSYDKSKHPMTMFTDEGIQWLLLDLYPRIVRLEAEGFFNEPQAA